VAHWRVDSLPSALLLRRLGAMGLICVAGWFGRAEAAKAAEPPETGGPGSAVRLEEKARVPLEVSIDKNTVDLEKRRLEVRMSRPAGHVRIKVLTADGGLLADDDIDFKGQPANARLVVTWTPSSDEPVARIEVYAYDQQVNYKGIAIVPWSLEIPHAEVN